MLNCGASNKFQKYPLLRIVNQNPGDAIANASDQQVYCQVTAAAATAVGSDMVVHRRQLRK